MLEQAMASRMTSIMGAALLASGFMMMSMWNTYDALITHGSLRLVVGALIFGAGAVCCAVMRSEGSAPVLQRDPTARQVN